MLDQSDEVVDFIYKKNRAAALDAISNMMDSSAAEAVATYKKVVASTYFDEPVEPLEIEQ